MARTGRWPARIALGLSATMVATFMTLMSMNTASGQGAGIPTVGIDVQSATLTQVTYAIVVRNQGSAPSTGVIVRSAVPAETTFESSDPPPSTTTSPGTGAQSCDNAGTREPEGTTCQWNLGTIPAGESRTITAIYNLNQSNVASYRVTHSATATDNEGNSNSDTDDSLVRQRVTVTDDTWVDDAEPPNTNHGTCNFLRVLQGNRVTSFVEADTLVTVPAATSNSTNSLERFYGAQLRLEVLSTTYTAQAPGTIGAHRITSAEWSQGGGSCQGGAGSGDQARTGTEPTSAPTPTGTTAIDGAPAIANFDVTADLDSEGERGSFQGWELRDQASTGTDNSTTFHSTESTTSNDASDPRIFLVYTTAESPTCIDGDPDTATVPVGGEHVMRALVTDGAKTPAPGNNAGSSMGPGGDACNGAPVAAPVEWVIEDDNPDIYFSSQEGQTIQKVVSGNDAQPNQITTTADDGTTFVGVRLDENPTTSDTTNRIEARIQGTSTADPDPSPSPTPAQQCSPATLPPNGNCSGETSVHDDMTVTWNTPSGSSGSTTGSASASTSASASSPSGSASSPSGSASSPSGSASSPSGSASSSTTGSPTRSTTSGSASSPQQSSRTITLFATPSEVVYPGEVTLSGQITSADNQCDDAGEFVRIQRRLFGETTYADFETDNTDADGRFEVTFAADENAEYVATAPRHDQCADATSSPTSVSVKVKITGRSGRRSVERGSKVGIVGRVQPDHDGTTVLLQRRKGTRWVTIARDDLNVRSRYRFVVKAGWKGRRTFRAVWKAQDDDHETNNSQNIVIRTTRP